jgi:hypothetical protein
MKRCLVIAFALILNQLSFAQAPETTIVIYGRGTRGPYPLGIRNVISGSLQLDRNGISFDPDSVAVQNADGIFTLSEPLAIGDSVVAKFRYLPLKLRRSYSRHTLEEKAPASFPAPIAPERFERFASDLKITGSKGFSIQTGQGAPDGLSQSLNLTIAGDLVPGLRTSANISDKSSGRTATTRRLDELDKVYIEAESDHFRGTFGDFDLSYAGDPLMTYQRKLTGLVAQYANRGNAIRGAAAFFPGEYRSITINGRDGLLGPYYLTDIGGRAGAQVLPGSERVHLDGALQKRGSQSDYEIDYGAGTIQFSAGKIIRDESRITIDYEVAREEYSRNLFAVSVEGRPAGGFRTFTSLLQEGDNKNSPRSFDLGDEDRAILERAGADRLAAAKSGARYAGPDSGNYVLDTLGGVHYVYVGSGNGNYDITFSFVGAGAGTYRALGAGAFQYVGAGGDYEPIILIPIPEMRRYGSAGAAWLSRDSAFSVGGQIAGSNLDRNTLSGHDRNFNDLTFLGNAGFRRAAFGPDGFVGIKALARAIGRNAIFPGRIDDVERYRRYDLASQESSQGERVQEIELSGWFDQRRRIVLELGYLTKPSVTDRNRQAVRADWNIFGPTGITSFIERTHGERSWWKTSDFFTAEFARAQPSAGLNFERRDGAGGFKYSEYIWRVPAEYTANISGATEITVRDEKYLENDWRDKFVSGAVSQRLSFLLAISGFSGDAAISYYKKSFRDFSGPDSEQKTGWTRLTFADPGGRGSVTVNERVGSSNERLRAKNYIFVGDSKGDYRLEDGEFIADPNGDYLLVIEELGEGGRVSEIGTEITAGVSPLRILSDAEGIEQRIGRLNIDADIKYELRKSSGGLVAGEFIPWDFRDFAGVSYRNGEFNLRTYYFPPVGGHRIKHSLARSFESGSQYANEATEDRARSDEASWAFPAGKKVDFTLTGLLAETRRSVNTLRYTVERWNTAVDANYHFRKNWTLSAGSSYEQARQSENGLRVRAPEFELGLARDFGQSGRASIRGTYARLNANLGDVYIPFQVARGRGVGDNFEAVISARMEVTKNGRFDLSYRFEDYPRRPIRYNLRLEFTVLFL